ncbi:MAG: Subtilisin-like protein serine protease [Candidatus Saccharibacteria bacterium]|nr:Subtilisin-like protein serine protease [Candidatus Saccharibacteria bacterium]
MKTQNYSSILRRTLSFLTSIVLVLGLLPSQFAFADTSNKLYITPDSSQMNVGTSFTVNVRSFSTASPATGSVTGTVLYTASKLQVTSISIGGSDYGSPTIKQGDGTIDFSGTRSPSPSGSAQIFAITFQASVAGSATVGFNGNSTINNTTTNYSGATFTVTSPTPPASPSSAPSSAPVSTPKSTPRTTYTAPVPVVTTPVVPSQPANSITLDSQPTPTPDPTGIIDTVVVTPSYTTAIVTWKVNANNPNSTLVYGESSTQMDKSGTVQNKGSGLFTALVSGLTPGNNYFFSISGGGSNTATGTYSSTIPAQGYPVTVSVTENGVASNGAQVQIGSSSFTTRQDGKITIGLAAGSYSGTISSGTATLNINLTVAEKAIPTDGTDPASQPFSFDMKSSVLSSGPGSGTTVFTFIGILFGGTVILVFGFLIFINIRRRKFDTGSDSSGYRATSSGPSVIIQDDYSWAPPTQGTGQPDQAIPPPPPTLEPRVFDQQQHHANSVYLSEDEPLDMFEQAKIDHTPSATAEPSIEQTPNLPHSTTP